MYLQTFDNDGIERVIECDEVMVGKQPHEVDPLKDAIRFTTQRNGLETTVHVYRKDTPNVYLLSNTGKTINSWDMSVTGYMTNKEQASNTPV